MPRLLDDIVQFLHIRVCHGDEDPHQEPVKDMGLELLDKICPAEAKHVGVYPQVAQGYTQSLCKSLHHLYHVEPAEERVPACKEQDGKVVGNSGVGDILRVNQGSPERFSIWVPWSILLLQLKGWNNFVILRFFDMLEKLILDFNLNRRFITASVCIDFWTLRLAVGVFNYIIV